jgi:serine/threonine-protein kinase RsbW
MGEKVNDHVVEVVLPNHLGYERIVMACSAAFAQMFNCPSERIEDLKTVVAEATINAIQHGNKNRLDGKVTISINYQDKAINVLVLDEGDGVRELPKKPDIERIMDELDPPIGFGVFLIKKLSDQVDFNATTKKGHAVKMTIKY